MFSGRKTKEFYIDLQDSRYYNPGEVVRGDVVLDVTKPTKINHIKIALSGTVQVGSNVLTLFTREDEIASEPNGSHLLEAKSNRFPFELNIPGASAELPTTMKLGDGSSHISYTILATLKRPFVPAPLAPEDTREISVVERIDVSNPEYDHPVPENEEDDKVMVDGTSLGVTIPKAAFVRGDIMPVSIKVACAEDFGKADAIRVALVRRFHLFGKGRRELLGEENAREPIYRDLIANPDNDHAYESTIKMFIPPSSPPTTGSSGRILRVEYTVQVSVDMNLARKNDGDWRSSLVVQKEIPVIIGTTPRADISIDDDDDEEECEIQNEATTTTTTHKVVNGDAASPEPSIPDNNVDDTKDDASTHDESAPVSDHEERVSNYNHDRQHQSSTSMSSFEGESNHQRPTTNDTLDPVQYDRHHIAQPPSFEQQPSVCQSPASFSHHSSSPYIPATHPSFDHSPPPPQHVSSTATHCFPPEPHMSYHEQPPPLPPPPPPSSVGHFPSPATTPFMPMPEPIPIHQQQPPMNMMPVPESYTSHSPSYPPFPSPTPPGYSHLTHKASHESWTMPTPYQQP